MYFDLNVPVPNLSHALTKRAKGKQPQSSAPHSFSAPQLSAIESRIDLLVHLGYTVIAFTQTVHKKVEAKAHINVVDALVSQLKQRPGIIILKRLTIVLDEDSEKGFGLINANLHLFNAYDLIALVPTTHTTFSLACLSHSLPSPLTAHIISLPLTLPRLAFHLKHTLIRTAIKNGAVFEINYVGALGGANDPALVDAGGAENGASAKRNWWAAAKELTRVTKGRGLIISGGVVADADLRAPRDAGNLVALLGLSQDVANESSTKNPKSLVLRAQTRKTYRAVLSEPRIIVPDNPKSLNAEAVPGSEAHRTTETNLLDTPLGGLDELQKSGPNTPGHPIIPLTSAPKRPREENTTIEGDSVNPSTPTATDSVEAEEPSKKKKRKKKQNSNLPV